MKIEDYILFDKVRVNSKLAYSSTYFHNPFITYFFDKLKIHFGVAMRDVS